MRWATGGSAENRQDTGGDDRSGSMTPAWKYTHSEQVVSQVFWQLQSSACEATSSVSVPAQPVCAA